LGWFEREKDVLGAFGDFMKKDAPYANSDSPITIKEVQGRLHDLCNVICPPFSDQGATPPGDMFNGIGYLALRKWHGYVDRSYHMSYDLDGDYPPYHGILCRDAIAKGRYPAILGLGWLWHYVMAYGYAYQLVEYSVPAPGTMVIRYFKCNMGWGPNSDPRWYHWTDTFWGSNINIWDGPNAYQ
jgi:hypothetical protein